MLRKSLPVLLLALSFGAAQAETLLIDLSVIGSFLINFIGDELLCIKCFNHPHAPECFIQDIHYPA